MVKTLTATFLKIDLGIEALPAQAAHQPVNASAVTTAPTVRGIRIDSHGPVIAIRGSTAPALKAMNELQAAAQGAVALAKLQQQPMRQRDGERGPTADSQQPTANSQQSTVNR